MDCIGKCHRYIFPLAVYIVFFSLISHAEISKDAQEWGYDDDDYDDYDLWWKKYLTSTADPNFPWTKFTSKPLDERDINTVYKKIGTDFIAIVAALFVIFVVFGCGAICCIKYVRRMDGSTVSSAVPNRLTNPNARQNNSPPVESSRTNTLQISTPTATPSVSFSIFRGAAGNSANLNNITDKPPAYGEVVLNDLSEQKYSYPTVKLNMSESPPPKYEETCVMKY